MTERLPSKINYDEAIVWQDHAHPSGYRPTLKMLYFPDGKQALELNVFGKVMVIPYTKAECGHD
jgi:hypothetical protein